MTNEKLRLQSRIGDTKIIRQWYLFSMQGLNLSWHHDAIFSLLETHSFKLLVGCSSHVKWFSAGEVRIECFPRAAGWQWYLLDVRYIIGRKEVIEDLFLAFSKCHTPLQLSGLASSWWIRTQWDLWVWIHRCLTINTAWGLAVQHPLGFLYQGRS